MHVWINSSCNAHDSNPRHNHRQFARPHPEPVENRFTTNSGVDEATKAGQITRTSQLAFPKDVCSTVYATDGYDGSAQNLSQTSLENDNVFGDDDGVHQLATVTGDGSSGYDATLRVGM
jgi:hypothetical protein